MERNEAVPDSYGVNISDDGRWILLSSTVKGHTNITGYTVEQAQNLCNLLDAALCSLKTPRKPL